MGTSALANVQNLAESVTRANDFYYEQVENPQEGQPQPQSQSQNQPQPDKKRNTGNTGNLFESNSSRATFDMIKTNTKSQNKKVVLSALESLERDMQLLDNITAEKTQLSQFEITLLSLSVAAAGSGPIFFVDGYKVAEVLAPACAARKF